MSARLTIEGARVVDPASGHDAVTAIHVADGRIAALGPAPDGFRADTTIDGKGLVACPGLVDLAARLREPGYEYRATLETEMQAAVVGGITSLACPPDTDPPLDEPGLVEMLKRRAASLEQARVFPVGALTLRLGGERLADRFEDDPLEPAPVVDALRGAELRGRMPVVVDGREFRLRHEMLGRHKRGPRAVVEDRGGRKRRRLAVARADLGHPRRTLLTGLDADAARHPGLGTGGGGEERERQDRQAGHEDTHDYFPLPRSSARNTTPMLPASNA